MKLFFDAKRIEDLNKEIKTVPVDVEGHVMEVGYTDMFVRGTVSKLVADHNALLQHIEKQAEWIATVINSYHHVMTYGLTQDGVSLVNVLPKAIKATEPPSETAAG